MTAISVFDRGSAVRATRSPRARSESSGASARSRSATRSETPHEHAEHHFAPPTLETAVVPRHPDDKGALHVALTQLAEQDPLIDLRQDDIRQELFLSLYGEVQKEVIQATLATDFDLDVEFRETTTICVERPVGTGAAVELIGQSAEPVPRDGRAARRAGRRRSPAWSSGSRWSSGRSRSAFFRAVEDTVRETLRQGLCGWQVVDCAVTMTHSGYSSPTSTAGDFRLLTPLVLMSALQDAGTVVCEPIHRFRLELPTDTLGQMLSALARLDAVPQAPAVQGSSCTIEGDIAAARVHELRLSCRD